MNTQERIDSYISEQPPAKGEDIRRLHRLILGLAPDARLWFLDGRNSEGKVVSNPNIGYGEQTMAYAGGGTREFYRIGLSGNATGVSVYVMGLEDKDYLRRTYGGRLGKADITGYCIRFRRLKDIDIGVFEELVADRLGAGSGAPARPHPAAASASRVRSRPS